jgi:hypothetical protein
MLTPEMGHPKLVDHFKEVLAIMRSARNWAEFYDMLDRSLPRFNETFNCHSTMLKQWNDCRNSSGPGIKRPPTEAVLQGIK